MLELLAINIGINPNIGKFGGLLLTWHGVFTAIGIVVGVWLSVRIANTDRVGIDPDTAYTLGMIVVACGIIGARALYVAERYGDANSGVTDFVSIFKINEGGISIYGALIGGALGGWAYGLWKKLPCALGADAAAFGMLIGLAIGRIGDLINGEHFAKASSLPWALTYSNPNSTAFARRPMQPAVEYEGLLDLVILGLLAFLWRRHPRSGVTFSLAFLLYSVMRFFVSFLRIDSKTIVIGLTTPQIVSLIVIPISLGLLFFFLRRKEPAHTPFVYGDRAPQVEARAERRRRERTTQPAGRSGTSR